ncbi:MAG: TIGR03862 family flavoprotein, partial [Alphaproteobacteria bacterium]
MTVAERELPALVIGGGPAGLAAAEVLAGAGVPVLVAEAKPSVARKFLMAGKSGLNLTKDEPFETFLAAYGASAGRLRPMLSAFGPEEARRWAEDLGEALFTGSTGRVFPRAMKASPLLRRWLGRLEAGGVTLATRWRCMGRAGQAWRFATPQGEQRLAARVTVLALGGASWPRLGSDAAWTEWLGEAGVPLAPFEPSNAALRVGWSTHMARHFGAPVKGVALQAGGQPSRGEFVISAQGLEGGGIYALSAALREGAPLVLDLAPDVPLDRLAGRLAAPRGKRSRATHLRKTARLEGAKLALLNEFARPLPEAPE